MVNSLKDTEAWEAAGEPAFWLMQMTGARGGYLLHDEHNDVNLAAGTAAELTPLAAAAGHLHGQGFTIVAANTSTRFGEIDLIAHKDDTIVFVEVKSLRAPRGAQGSLTQEHTRRTRQIRRLAAAWLNDTEERPSADEIRFDAISVTVGSQGEMLSIDHIVGAF